MAGRAGGGTTADQRLVGGGQYRRRLAGVSTGPIRGLTRMSPMPAGIMKAMVYILQYKLSLIFKTMCVAGGKV